MKGPEPDLMLDVRMDASAVAVIMCSLELTIDVAPPAVKTMATLLKAHLRASLPLEMRASVRECIDKVQGMALPTGVDLLLRGMGPTDFALLKMALGTMVEMRVGDHSPEAAQALSHLTRVIEGAAGDLPEGHQKALEEAMVELVKNAQAHGDRMRSRHNN